MKEYFEVTIEEGDEDQATLLKIRFTPLPIYFAFRAGRDSYMSRLDSKEIRKREVREAIASFVHKLERSLLDASRHLIKD